MVSGKDSSNPLVADNLPKIVWYSTHHVALMRSWLVQKQTTLGQTATGKEISNPFMAGSFPKTILLIFIHFGTTVAVKKVNDVTRLQALVDKKKVVVTEATIRDALRLDDVEGNVENVNAGDAAEGDVSAANDEVPTADEEPSIPSPTPPTPPPQPSRDIPSISQVQPTPLQPPQVQPQSTQPQPQQDAGIPMNLLQKVMDTCIALTRRVEYLELDKIAQALEITKLKRRVKKLERKNKGRMIAEMDADADVVLEEAKEVAADAKADQDTKEEESEPVELQEVVDNVTTAKIITEVVTAASTTITATEVPVPAATTAAAPKLTAAPSRRTKGVVIRDPEESSTTKSTIIHSEAKSKDKGKGILVEEPKPLKKQAQVKQDEKYARELEAELNRTIY
nr:hypothetical protein [Tanacetum cinerariifolium]